MKAATNAHGDGDAQPECRAPKDEAMDTPARIAGIRDQDSQAGKRLITKGMRSCGYKK
jgi:hypothetical protein